MKSVSFRIADQGSSAKFSHFIESSGYIVVAQLDVEIALVGIIANHPSEVTGYQRQAIFNWAESATKKNPDVALCFHAGLSPFYTGVVIDA